MVIHQEIREILWAEDLSHGLEDQSSLIESFREAKRMGPSSCHHH